MNIFGLPALAVNVAADTLREFITIMLLTLIDMRVSNIQEGDHLMKVPVLIPLPPSPILPTHHYPPVYVQ